MVEEVANEAVAVTFVHGQRVVCAGTEDAWSEILSQRGDKGLISRGELNKAGEVRGDGV